MTFGKRGFCWWVVVIVGCLLDNLTFAEPATGPLQVGTVQFPKTQLKISVEIADNPAERARGLMYRKELTVGHGMLFVFDSENKHQVWMKNVSFPLDVLFISAKGRVVALLKNLPPCQSNTCQIYDPGTSAKYMLELNAGFIEKEAVKRGDSLLFFL